MKKPKLRELAEAIKSLFSLPYTKNYPFEPSIPPDGFRGKPEFYKNDCIGCGACAEVCPAAAIEIIDTKIDNKSGVRTLIHHQDICIYCGQCEKNCLTKSGIKLTKEYELSTTDLSTSFTKIEKELVYCDHCGEAIACKDHLKWLSNKLGTLAFANPTILSAKMQELDLIARSEPQENLHKRSSHNKMLCPNCRREVIITEQW